MSDENVGTYFRGHGQGAPMLLIMGLGGHTLDWKATLPQKLAKRYKVIMFDNRGAGRSDQPFGPYSIRQISEEPSA